MTNLVDYLKSLGAGFTDPLVSAVAMYGNEDAKKRAQQMLQQSAQLNQEHPIAYNLGEAALGVATIPARLPIAGTAAFSALLDYLKSQGDITPQQLAASAAIGGATAALPVIPGRIMKAIAEPATTAVEKNLLTKAEKLGFKLTAGDFLGKYSAYNKIEDIAIRSAVSGNAVEAGINQVNQAVLKQRLATILGSNPSDLTTQGIAKVRLSLVKQKNSFLPQDVILPRELAIKLGVKPKSKLSKRRLKLILNNLSKQTVSSNEAQARAAKQLLRDVKTAILKTPEARKAFDEHLAKISLTHALENSLTPAGEVLPRAFVKSVKQALSKRQQKLLGNEFPDILDVVENWRPRFEPTVEKSSISSYMQTGGVGGAIGGTMGYMLAGPPGSVAGTTVGVSAPAVISRTIAKKAVGGKQMAEALMRGPSIEAVTAAKGLGAAIGSIEQPRSATVQRPQSIEAIFQDQEPQMPELDYEEIRRIFND